MGNDLNDLLGLSRLSFAALLWSLGAEDDDDDDLDDDDDDDDGDDKPAAKGRKGEDPEIKRLRSESKKRRLALREAEKEKKELADRLKALEDKDKTDLERTSTELEDLRKQVDKLTPRLQESERKLKFFESGVAAQFQNPAHALKLIDVSDIDDDDPEALAEAIKEKAEALLKEAPYLKASAAGSGDGGNDGDGKTDGDGAKPPSTETGSTSRGAKGKPDTNADLVKRFPALAGRVQ